ncbi:MAG: hypothetical protein D6741_08320 [Planctomycetota bacterium]|nr:MAG: hypothetical protein D6741_08320 [Planctomycetota bacterium]
MNILVRNNDSNEWEPANPVSAKAEVELQDLFLESPSLIPVEEIREGVSQLVFAVGEFGLPGSGNTDILAFSADGDIAIVECKLAANPESKRKVIGQILEYAAFLWGMSYRELDSRIRRMRGKALPALIEEAVAGDWDQDNFEQGISQSLAAGSFILIIVVDQINEELRRIIRYINECSESAFSLHALEAKRFKASGIDILVPQVYGLSAKPTGSTSAKRTKWNRDTFFEELRKNVDPGIVDLADDLYQWAEATADRVSFGTGVQIGSFTFHYIKDGKVISVFTIRTNGEIKLNYGWMSTRTNAELFETFHRRIIEIPTFSNIPDDFSKWPTLKMADAFAGPEEIQKFKQVVEWLGAEIGRHED